MEKEIYEIQDKPKGFASLGARILIGTSALGITGFVAFAGVEGAQEPSGAPVQSQAKVSESISPSEPVATEESAEPAVPAPEPVAASSTPTITQDSVSTTETTPVAPIGSLAGVEHDDDDDDWEEDDDHEDREEHFGGSDHDDDHEDSDYEDD